MYLLKSSTKEDGAQVRNPSKTVGAARGHQMADTLKPQTQKTSHSNHTDHSLV